MKIKLREITFICMAMVLLLCAVLQARQIKSLKEEADHIRFQGYLDGYCDASGFPRIKVNLDGSSDGVLVINGERTLP